jgi:hypothetical protein
MKITKNLIKQLVRELILEQARFGTRPDFRGGRRAKKKARAEKLAAAKKKDDERLAAARPGYEGGQSFVSGEMSPGEEDQLPPGGEWVAQTTMKSYERPNVLAGRPGETTKKDMEKLASGGASEEEIKHMKKLDRLDPGPRGLRHRHKLNAAALKQAVADAGKKDYRGLPRNHWARKLYRASYRALKKKRKLRQKASAADLLKMAQKQKREITKKSRAEWERKEYGAEGYAALMARRKRDKERREAQWMVNNPEKAIAKLEKEK